MSVPTTTSSATSLNFVGFDEMKGNGTAPILFNRVVILPPPRETAGKWIHPAAGFIPGQQFKFTIGRYNLLINGSPNRATGKLWVHIIKDPPEAPTVLRPPATTFNFVYIRQYVASAHVLQNKFERIQIAHEWFPIVVRVV